MRQDKLTTKLQEALSDSQSLAVGNDNQYIEPVHLLTALLNQDDGSARSLLQRAGVNVGGLTKALTAALERLPKVTGTWPATGPSSARISSRSRGRSALLSTTTGEAPPSSAASR